MFSQNSVTVITAATGHRNLAKCLRSVQQQTFAGVEHFLVIDGLEREAQVKEAVAGMRERFKPIHLITLPHPTGKDNWNGHRIYGAMPFLSNSEFVSFLDEDNWIDPEHLESLVAEIRATQAKWAFSLRKIVNGEGEFLTLDQCESLGNLHPIFNTKDQFHVDANCYLLPREVAVELSSSWYSPARALSGRAEPDRILCHSLLRSYPNACSNRKPTVNYAVGNRPDSVTLAFFLCGNQVMANTYPTGLPWERQS